MMNKCKTCGKHIGRFYGIGLIEYSGDIKTWLYKFCSWKCLIQYLIDKGMIKTELTPCE